MEMGYTDKIKALEEEHGFQKRKLKRLKGERDDYRKQVDELEDERTAIKRKRQEYSEMLKSAGKEKVAIETELKNLMERECEIKDELRPLHMNLQRLEGTNALSLGISGIDTTEEELQKIEMKVESYKALQEKQRTSAK